MTGLIAASPAACPAFRISPGDSNYFALLVDPAGQDVPFVTVIEIFTVGGRTPPNTHARAHEQFYVLRGEGRARCGESWVALRQGDVLVVPPGAEHVLENTGSGKLYCLTTMVPDEGFAALIRNGQPVALDAEDLEVLRGRAGTR